MSNPYPDYPALLAAIRRRPGMFLGDTTINGLHLLILGISYAEDFHDVPEKSRIGGFDYVAFEEWTARRHNPRRLTLNSFSLAAHIAGSDKEGFALWFRWYDDFVAGVPSCEPPV